MTPRSSSPSLEEAAFQKPSRDLLPEVGMGATVHGWSDSHACTVIAVNPKKSRIVVQRDKATLLNGVDSGEPDALTFSPGGFVGHTSGTQRYRYERDPEGATYAFSRRVRKDGEVRWVLVGESLKNGTRATLGKRHEHYDFNF